MCEHYRPRLEAVSFQSHRHRRANSAQPDVPEFIAASLQGRRSAVFLVAIGKFRAFRYHHDAEISSRSLRWRISSATWSCRKELRHQDDVGAARDAAVAGSNRGRPSLPPRSRDCAPPPWCARGRWLRWRYSQPCRSRSEVGTGQVIVNRLRNPHHFTSFSKSSAPPRACHRRRWRSAPRSHVLEVVDAALQPAIMLGRISPRSAQNRAPTRQDAPTDERSSSMSCLPAIRASLHESHETVFIVKDAFAHDCPNDCIQPGTVAPPSAPQFHCLLLI